MVSALATQLFIQKKKKYVAKSMRSHTAANIKPENHLYYGQRTIFIMAMFTLLWKGEVKCSYCWEVIILPTLVVESK
jgi:hypothetical protein